MSDQKILSRREILQRIQNGRMSSEEGFELLREVLPKANPHLKVEAKTGETGYYREIWEKSEIKSEPDGEKTNQHYLIFGFSREILKFFKAQWKNAENVQFTLVNPGPEYHAWLDGVCQIRPANQDDYIALFNDLERSGAPPTRIIHLWSRQEFGLEAERIREQLAHGIYSLFLMSKVLIGRKIKDKVKILYVYPDGDGRSVTQPLYSAISGFARVLANERPMLECKVVGLKSDNDGKLAEVLYHELAGWSGELEIAYEAGQRYVKRYQKISARKVTNRDMAVKENGVYLIIGGAGALGFVFARYLANQAKVKIVISGRKKPDAAKRSQIRELESLGAEVLYIRADLSRYQDVEKLVARVKKRFSGIDGVIHSAGVTRDALLLKKTLAEMEEVMAAKVFGTIWLDRALGNENLDFFVLFSSLAAVLGSIGQSDYAYANKFLDCYAMFRENLRRKNQRNGKTVSINWPLWKGGGIRADAELQKWVNEDLGLPLLSNEEGISSFEQVMGFHDAQVIVLPGGGRKIAGMLNKRFEENGVNDPLAGTKQDHARLRQKMEEYLKNMVAKETKMSVEQVNPQDSFERYGVDSLVIMNLTRYLEKDFGMLSKTLFFEYQNLAELTAYFLENHEAKLNAKFGKAVTDGDASDGPLRRTRENIGGISRPRFLSSPFPGRKDEVSREAEIAIIGISGRYPMADDLQEFWENLKLGKDCISEIPAERWPYQKYYDPDKKKSGTTYSRWGGFINDIDKFDPLFFNISPREAEFIDPQERLFLETVWSAMEDSGYTRGRLARERVGVFVGVMYGQFQLFGAEGPLGDDKLIPVSSYASIANRVSYHFNFHGPSIALDTMCSSSLTAIHLACDSLKKGECQMAVAGGVNVTIHPHKYLQLSQSKFLSSDGKCRSFGEGGDGYVPGEGVGAVFLKPLRQAIEDGDHIYAVIRGSALNHGGKTNGYTVPNPNAQGDLIIETLEAANINPREISYLEAHGTGTALGDPIEISGLMKAYHQYTNDRQYCSIGSVKSNVGHLESAAGIAGITKILLQMQHRQLVPSLHSAELNSHINFSDSPFYVQQRLEDWLAPDAVGNGETKRGSRIAGISSFGAGGSNAHIILEEWDDSDPGTEDQLPAPYIVTLSAKNKERLKEYARKLRGFLEKASEPPVSALNPADLAYTFQVGREAMEERLALVVSNLGELVEKLTRYAQGQNGIEGLYQGSARGENQLSAGIIYKGNTGKEIIRILIKNQEFGNIAQLWACGVAVDWQLLYEDAAPRKISVPSYPFARKRYWIPESGKSISAPAKLHPLIHGNISNLNQIRFCTKLTGNEFLVDGWSGSDGKVMPDLLVIEMFRAAGAIAGEKEIHKIRDIRWGQPLVAATGFLDLEVGLFPGTPGVDCEISMVGEDQRIMVGAQGKLEYWNQGEEHSGKDSIDLAAIKRRCVNRWSHAEFYKMIPASPPGYFPNTEVLREVYANQTESLSRFIIPDRFRERESGYWLSPVLMAGIVQTAAVLLGLETADAGVRYVMDRLNEVEFLEAATPENLIYVEAMDNKEAPGIAGGIFNVWIGDEDGKTFARLNQLIIKSVGQNREGIPDRPQSQTGGRAVAPEVLREKMIADLKKAVAKLIKLSFERVDLDENLGDYGFESVTLVELAEQLGKAYGIEITPTVLFNQSSIRRLSEYLVEEYYEEILHYYAVSEPYTSKTEIGEEFLRRTLKPLKNQVEVKTKPRALYGSGAEPIAIIGMNGMFPGSRNLEEYWDNLVKEKDLITEIPSERWDWKDYHTDYAGGDIKTKVKWGGFVPDVDKFDARFFNINPLEAEMMDPQQRLLLESVWKTIEDGGYKGSDFSGRRVGLFVGIQFSDYLELLAREGILNPQMGLGNEHSIAVNRISYLLNLRGPSEPYNTACSSSGVAIHRAVNSIRSGESEMAIAGGISLMLNPYAMIGSEQLGIISPDGRCKTLDKSANGYVKGEGVGTILLKPLRQAVEDRDFIYGLIKGTAVNHGGKANSLTAPNSVAQAELLVTAYEEAGIEPESVTYLELHGTGTELGDPIEIEGLKSAFQQLAKRRKRKISKSYYCGLGSAKTNIGHLEPASGIAGLIKVILAMQNGKLPGILHFQELNPYVKIDQTPFYIVKKTRQWERLKDEREKPLPYRAGVSSFGFGGVNSHIVIEEYQKPVYQLDSSGSTPHIFILSAKNEERLWDYASQFLDFLIKKQLSWSHPIDAAFPQSSAVSGAPQEQTFLKETVYTLQVGREAMNERLACVVSSVSELIEKLNQFVHGQSQIKGLYCGNITGVKERRPAKEIKLTDPRGEINEKVSDELAQLWVKGQDIDWKSYYQAQKPYRMSLPTYPFARVRYWAPKGVKPNQENYTKVHDKIEVATTAEVYEDYGETADDDFVFNKLRGILAEKIKLNEDEIKANVNLTEYGVDSLLSAMISQIVYEEFGVQVSAGIIVAYPTLRELSDYIQKELGGKEAAAMNARVSGKSKLQKQLEVKTKSLPKLPPELVPINTKGSRQISFWAPAAVGYSNVFRNLSEVLGPEYPFYAFQAKGIDGKTLPRKFEEMAECYLECLRLVQPHGPYFLGGYSFGGLVILEIARRLKEAGEEILHIVMIDTFPPSETITNMFLETYDSDFLKLYLANSFLNIRENPSLIISKQDIENVPSRLHAGHLARLVKQRSNTGIGLDEIYNFIKGGIVVSEYAEEIHKEHRPLPYDISDVLYFKTTEGFLSANNPIGYPRVDIFKDYDYSKAWFDLIKTELKIIPVASDHNQILDGPMVPYIASYIEPLLRKYS
jgi:acyl transferase domain-containing protein/thioesterase domain-containing protein/NADP-dependent 3-hydroxy acid dehydrogenase YdfG